MSFEIEKMTVEEVLNNKMALEEEILNLICQFEVRTELQVHDIHYTKTRNAYNGNFETRKRIVVDISL